MRIAILESIVMPAGHEVEFDRILVKALTEQGHEPRFFVPEKFPFKINYGVPVDYLSGGEAVSYAGAGGIKKLFLSALRENRRRSWFEAAYDKVQSGLVEAIIVPTATYRYLRTLLNTRLLYSPVPVYFIFHGINPAEKPKFEKFAAKCLKFPNIQLRVISLRKDFADSGLTNVREILPPVFQPQTYQAGPVANNQGPIKIGFFGQFRKEKNLEFLLEAFTKAQFAKPVELIVQGATAKPEDTALFDDIIKRYSSYENITFLHKNLIGAEWETAIRNIDIMLLPYGAERYLYHWSAMLFTAIGFYKPVLQSEEINPEVLRNFSLGAFIDMKDEVKFKTQLKKFIDVYRENSGKYNQELLRANGIYAQTKMVANIISNGEDNRG